MGRQVRIMGKQWVKPDFEGKQKSSNRFAMRFDEDDYGDPYGIESSPLHFAACRNFSKAALQDGLEETQYQ